MFYGDQSNISLLESLQSKNYYFDVIVDDGGHRMEHQLTSFTYLLPKVKSGGLYVIEDLLTSYMQSFGGGYLLKWTTIEFIKRLVDDIQDISPRKSTKLAQRIYSFEIANEICFFNVK